MKVNDIRDCGEKMKKLREEVSRKEKRLDVGGGWNGRNCGIGGGASVELRVE